MSDGHEEARPSVCLTDFILSSGLNVSCHPQSRAFLFMYLAGLNGYLYTCWGLFFFSGGLIHV